MFDEGENEVTIHLPEAARNVAKNESEMQVRQNEDFFEEDDSQIIKEVMPIRDFSISTWNGIGGLKYWGYSSKPEDDAK